MRTCVRICWYGCQCVYTHIYTSILIYICTNACVCANSFPISQHSIHVRMELNLLQNVSNLPIPLSQEPWLYSHTKLGSNGKVHWIIRKSKKKNRKREIKNNWKFIWVCILFSISFGGVSTSLLATASLYFLQFVSPFHHIRVCVSLPR